MTWRSLLGVAWLVALSLLPAHSAADDDRCDDAHLPACVREGVRLRDAHPPRAVTARAYLQRACDGGSADGCRRLAETLQRADDDGDRERVAALFLRARDRYELACARGAGDACTAAGELFADEGDGPDPMRAADALFRRACDLDDAGGCARFGEWLAETAEGPADIARARSVLTRACARGAARACRSYVVTLESLAARGALEVLQRGCTLGDGPTCDLLGAELAWRPGQGEAAADAFDRACAQGAAASCGHADLLRGRLAAERACAAGDALRCVRLGAILERGTPWNNDDAAADDEARARSLYTRACEGGVAAGCTALGVIARDGRGVARDDARARGLFESSCRAGDMAGCTALGGLYRDRRAQLPSPDAARSLFDRACHGGDLAGCAALGALYEEGRGVARDLATARGLYDLACTYGGSAACSRLGSLYARGLGVALDTPRALRIHDRALGFADTPAARREATDALRASRAVVPTPTRPPAPTPPPPSPGLPASSLRATLADPRVHVDALDPERALPRLTLTREALPNGLDVVVARDEGARSVEVSLTVRVGHADAPLDRRELAHLVEHLTLLATRHAPEGIHPAQVRVGMARGNGETDVDGTEYWVSVEPGAVEHAVWLLSNAFGWGTDALSPDNLARERRVIEHELTARLGGWSQLSARLLRMTLPQEHVQHQPPHLDGAIGALTLDDAAAFFARWYAPANARLVIVGDVDPAATRRAATRWFGPITARPAPTPQRPQVAPQAHGEMEVRGRAPNSHDRVAYVWSGVSDDAPDAIAWEAVMDALDRLAAGPPRGSLRLNVHRLLASTTALAVLSEVHPASTQEAALRGLDAWLLARRDELLGEGTLLTHLTPIQNTLTRRLLRDAEDPRTRALRLARWPDPADPGAFRRDLRAIRSLRVDDMQAVVRRSLDPVAHATLRITHDPNRPSFAVVRP